MAREESFVSRTAIYVGGLRLDATEAQLYDGFSMFGTLISIRLAIDDEYSQYPSRLHCASRPLNLATHCSPVAQPLIRFFLWQTATSILSVERTRVWRSP